MAYVDRQAALEELKKATSLRTKAEELVGIADELEEEANRHEHDAMDLIAPAKMSPSAAARRS